MSASNAAQPLQGRTALVVQANAGVGAAVTEAFAAAGAKVMINYLNGNDEADQVAHRIRARQGQAMIFQADINQESQVKSMFDVLVAYWGSLDILVTNANLAIDDSLMEMNPEQWHKVLIQNLSGQFLCVRGAMREFLRRGAQSDLPTSVGKVICLSTLLNSSGSSELFNYTVCKPDTSKLLKTFALGLGQENTRIDLYSTSRPTLSDFRNTDNLVAIDSNSVKLMSRNQEDIVTAAVGLALTVCR